MTRDGRASADAIARGQLAEAARLAAAAAAESGDARSERFAVVAEACALVAGGGEAGPRIAGLPLALALRAVGANLRDECCRETAEGVPGERYPLSIRLHHALDAAATALGASPDCFADPDDWSLPDEEEPAALVHLSATARNAAMVCQGLRDLIGPSSGGTALMRRDVFRLVAGALALRVACLDPAGLRPSLVRELAAETQAGAERICAAAAAWRSLAPEAPVGRLGHAVESAALLAGDILADLHPAAPPAP